MVIERRRAEPCGRPFPIYEDLAPRLLAAHATANAGRDPMVAHVLGSLSGYAYGDVETVSSVGSRLGLDANVSVRITQVVDAMMIYSTAYLVQSRCGRLAILCYRGTEQTNLGNWLGDADVGPDSVTLGAQVLAVHSGFYRNVRATRHTVIEQLNLAAEGRLLLDPEQRVDHPLEALYLAGHSLGGAMAVLFSLGLIATPAHRAIADKLRAIYTFGQPLTLGEPVPEVARELGRKLFRHINARDIIPSLPAAPWGRFAHFGHEYHYDGGEWRPTEAPVAQLSNLRQVPRAVLSFLGTAKRRDSSRYSLADHGPHRYIEALRPSGSVTEFGDQG